jgi:hypothetical protein
VVDEVARLQASEMDRHISGQSGAGAGLPMNDADHDEHSRLISTKPIMPEQPKMREIDAASWGDQI